MDERSESGAFAKKRISTAPTDDGYGTNIPSIPPDAAERYRGVVEALFEIVQDARVVDEIIGSLGLRDYVLQPGRTTEAIRLFHMVLRQSQAAYAAGLRDGSEACMEWLGNALRGPGQAPSEGADPQWYSEDAWTQGPPWQAIPKANATLSEPFIEAPHSGRSPEEADRGR